MTPKKEKALQCLLTYPSQKTAARAAGVSDNTMRAYLRDPEFKAEYEQAVAEVITDAARQAQQALSPAISALVEIVQNKDENTSARISAARSLLEYGLRLTEFNDILRELDDLEGGLCTMTS